MCLLCNRPKVESTELCEIASKYGTDKVPPEFHSYTPVYYELMKDRRDIKKMLEIGIGTPDTMGHMGTNYKPGASLRMWKEFFPLATIYGCDWKEEAMVNEDRIKTFLCDQSNGESVLEMMKEIGKVNFIVDDGSHQPAHQVVTAMMLLPFLEKDGIYVIEDVVNAKAIAEYFVSFDVEVRDFRVKRFHGDDQMIIIKYKKDAEPGLQSS